MFRSEKCGLKKVTCWHKCGKEMVKRHREIAARELLARVQQGRGRYRRCCKRFRLPGDGD